jgi:hypothetical protein
MKLIWKWLLVSVGGGIIVTVVLSTLPDRLIDAPEDKPHPMIDRAVEVVFWPIEVCVYLSGHGAPIGPPEKHMYEATPVQIFAVFVGIALSWVFYSSLVFLIVWVRRRRRNPKIPSSMSLTV